MPLSEKPVTFETSDGVHVTATFVEDDQGRRQIGRLELEGIITSDTLRGLPLGRLRAWAQQHADAYSLAFGDVYTSPDHPSPRAAIDSLRFDIPPRRRRGDDFYQAVGAAFGDLVAAGDKAPAQSLATANEVPVTTVHGWVREARARGFLPPTRKGSAS